MTGTIATANSATAARKVTITASTAIERLSPRRTRKSTEGARPAARNIETTMSIRVLLIESSVVPSHQAISAPRPPKNPR